MATTYSSLHQVKTPRLPQPIKHKTKPIPPPPLSAPLTSMSNIDPLATARTSSLAGRKRPRESEGDVKIIPRRTKSVGAPLSAPTSGKSSSRDREAFQRGLIAVFVPKALEESSRGIMGNYNDLLASFLPTPLVPVPPLQPLLPLLRSLTANVNLLSPGLHSPLVSAIIALPWAAAEERFVKAYIGWAGILISAHPDWTKEVVGMAVKGLTWQYPLQSTSTPSLVTRRISHARHHLLLTHLLALIPTLPNLLAPLLVRHFPNKRDREVAQITYLRNICEVADYCPELNARIWDQVIDRMLRIDVEITRAGETEDDDDDDDEEDERLAEMCKGSELQGDPWDMNVMQDVPPDPSIRDQKEEEEDDDDGEIDLENLSDEEEGGSDDEAAPPNEAKEALNRMKKKLHLILMRRKLDGMMVYFSRHLEESMGYRSSSPPATELAASTLTANSSGRSTPTIESPLPQAVSRKPRTTPAQSLATFQILLTLFSRQILPTSATQHIPFLLFLCASFSPAHTDLFLGLLVSHSLYGGTTAPSALTLSQPISLIQRTAATVYIGSIVCRARFVKDDQARQVMTYLLAFIEGKLSQAKISPLGKVDELPLFYAVCQAVMLIFCFRWRAFLAGEKEDEVVGELELEGEDAGEGKWMRELDVLQRALTSDLNPLLGCNTTIVQTFAKVAHQTNFAYCYSILESNASAARSASSHSLSSLARPNPQPNNNNNNNGNKSTFARSLSTPTASTGSLTPSGNTPFDRFRRSQPSQNHHTTPANLSVPRLARQANIDSGLDGYFPFDPYDLPRSGTSIEGFYRTWKEVAVDAGGESDDSDEDSDEEEEEEEEDDDEGEEDEEDIAESPLSDHLSPRMVPRLNGSAGKSKSKHVFGSSAGDRKKALRDGGLSSSFDGMSISPRFSGALPGKNK